MCIRDSYETFRKGIEHEDPAVCVNVIMGLVRVTRYLLAQPVSYTHLRAHETVLELVCRLLLEKKNFNVLLSTSLLPLSKPLHL